MNYTYTGGYSCPLCGQWITGGIVHFCPTNYWTASVVPSAYGKKITLSRQGIKFEDLEIDIQIDTHDIEIAIDGNKVIVRKKNG